MPLMENLDFFEQIYSISCVLSHVSVSPNLRYLRFLPILLPTREENRCLLDHVGMRSLPKCRLLFMAFYMPHLAETFCLTRKKCKINRIFVALKSWTYTRALMGNK